MFSSETGCPPPLLFLGYQGILLPTHNHNRVNVYVHLHYHRHVRIIYPE